MLENVLAVLLAYKKELIYLAVFLLGFCFSLLLTADCDRDTICLDDINSKKAAFKAVEESKSKHVKALRKQEDDLKEQCKKNITQALKHKSTGLDSLNCLVCKNLILQCE